MTRSIIIHAGFHKTASSSIQHSLAENRTLLENHGFSYPDFEFEGTRFFNRSIPLTGYFMKNPEIFKHYWYHSQLDHRLVNRRIQVSLDEALDKTDKLIFSDEFLSTMDQEDLQKTKAYFDSRGVRLRVISYVREPFNHLVSAVQQRCKVKSVEEVLQSIDPRDTAKNIDRLKTVFGSSAEFYSFENTCRHEHGPVGFFFDLLGVKQDADTTLRVNEGISNQAARLSSYINHKIPLFASKRRINPRRRRLDLDPIHEIRGDRFGLTHRELEMVMTKISRTRTEISDLLGRGFLPARDVSSIAEQVTWTAEQLNEVLATSASLDWRILSAISQYFHDPANKIHVESPESLERLVEIAERRARDEGVTGAQSILEPVQNFLTVRLPRKIHKMKRRKKLVLIQCLSKHEQR